MSAGHTHAPENPYAGQGAVLLDIGGDVGAVVVEMPAATVGHEVEIWPRGRAGVGHAPHVAVVERPTSSGTVPALVFAEVAAGDYDLCAKGSDVVRLAVTVRGAEVSELSWPVG
jgi:hypothetical protein